MNDSPIDPVPAVPPKAPGLIQRVRDILTQPSPTWGIIAAEPASIKSLYLGYVMPLAAIGPVAAAIGTLIFGSTSFTEVILGAVLGYVLSLVMVYVLALLVDVLAPAFGGQRSMIQAFKLVAYANTAGWVAAVLNIVPAISILAIAGALYGLYLMFLGLPRLMKSPSAKSLPYMIVVAILNFIAALLVGFLVSLVLAPALMVA
jgi:hypothetical protein